MRSSRVLRRLYQSANRKHFSSRLPVRIVLSWKEMDRAIGRMEYSPEGYAILIDPRIRTYPSIVVMTLLHEMTHLYVMLKYGKRGRITHHGELFQREMLRLAKRGAFASHW